MLGGWLLSWAPTHLLTLIVGVFLVSNAMRYRLGERVRSFPMPVPCFIPVSVVVGLVSGLVGASSLISLPFYLNYGLTKERCFANGWYLPAISQCGRRRLFLVRRTGRRCHQIGRPSDRPVRGRERADGASRCRRSGGHRQARPDGRRNRESLH